MKTLVFGAGAACLAVATPFTQGVAAEPPQHDHVAHTTGTSAQTISEQARKATTPDARRRLMQENMAAMKARMAEMHAMMAGGGMMADKPVPMGMAMDADHMAKMHKHMTMMHEMMERMMIQQELMMKPAK